MQNLKYAIMALIFVSIIKIMQVTLFDADKYNKNKKTSFSKEVETVSPKTEKNKANQPVSENKETSNTAKEAEPVLARTEADSAKANDKPIIKKDEPAAPIRNSSLSDLKNNYLAPIVSKLPPGQLREDVVIRYYRHDKDEEKVYSLKNLGYYIHEKEATETAGLGSNVIYYGEDVNLKDIQIVALTLLEKGIPLKSIQRSRYDWKSNSIEIGTDPLLSDKSAITLDYIYSFAK